MKRLRHLYDKVLKRSGIDNGQSVRKLNKKNWDIPVSIFSKRDLGLAESHLKDKNRFVSLKEALESKEYKSATAPLSFPLGKDQNGKFVIANYAELPHIIAGGNTTSGKTVFETSSLISSLIYRNSPDDLKLIIADPMMVEFVHFCDLPHLQMPIISELTQYKDAIGWLLAEMNRRYAVLADSKTSNIDEYNKSGKGHLPYILLLIDESSDIMYLDQGHFESVFIQLLQKAKPVGIHLYIGTQRPDPDVLTDKLIQNVLTKIAFATSTESESIRLIGMGGAEKLLGFGDLLAVLPNKTEPIRLQAPYATYTEQEKLVEYIKNIVK